MGSRSIYTAAPRIGYCQGKNRNCYFSVIRGSQSRLFRSSTSKMSQQSAEMNAGGLGDGGELPMGGERARGGRGGSRGGRSGRGGGRGGGGSEGNREFLVSKSLSWILRHGAEKEGLALDGEGFARCDELVSFLHSITFFLVVMGSGF